MRGSCLLVVIWLSAAALLTNSAVAGGDSACDNHSCFTGVKQWCQGVCPFDPLNFGALCATTCAAAAGNASSCLNSSNDTTGQALLDTLDVLAPACAVLAPYTATTLTPCKGLSVDDTPCAAVANGAPCSSGCMDVLNQISSPCRGYLATLIYYVAIPSDITLEVLQTCGVGPYPNLNGGHPIPSVLPWDTDGLGPDAAPDATPTSAPALGPSQSMPSSNGTIESANPPPAPPQAPAPTPTDTISASTYGKVPPKTSSSLSAGVIAAIVVAAVMCVLVLVLLALFLVQRHRQGTNIPRLIPGLPLRGQSKGGPRDPRGKALKVLNRGSRSDSFSLDANPSGFAHLIRDSESHSTGSPPSQSELPVTTSEFGVKGGASGGGGSHHIWSNASTQDWFLGANPVAAAASPPEEKPWFSDMQRVSPFPPPQTMLEATQMEVFKHGVPGLGNQNSEALGYAVSLNHPTSQPGYPTDADDAMNWDLQPEQVQPCRTADGKPVILGTGAYGNVYKGTLNGVTEVAIKVLHNDMDLPRFRQEISILKRCRDNNIVNYLGAFRQAGRTMLVTEFMGQGNLFKALQTHRQDGSLSWRKRGHDIALNIARGLVYMHGCSPRVIHFDLKSPNILLSSEGVAKIADVGLSRVLSQTHVSNPRFVGTFAWAAPELLTGTRCSELVDVYSMGVCMWELITGEQPERGCLRAPRVPEECSRAVGQLMDQCLLPTPERRPTALEVYERLLALQHSPEDSSTDTSSSSAAAPGPLSEASSIGGSSDYVPAAPATLPSPFLQQGGVNRRPSSLPSPFAPQLPSSPTSRSGSPVAASIPLPQRLNGGASTLISPFQQATGSGFGSRQQPSASASLSPFAALSQQQATQSSTGQPSAGSPASHRPVAFGLTAIPESSGPYSSSLEPLSSPAPDTDVQTSVRRIPQPLGYQQQDDPPGPQGLAAGYNLHGLHLMPGGQESSPAPGLSSHKKTMSV